MSETGDQMASAFVTKLAGLTSTSQSIETLSHWCVFHRKRAKILAPAWQRELRAAPPKRKLSFLYLANDVMQNSRKKGSEWIEALWPIMSWATRHTLRNTGDDKTQKSCAKLVKVWQDRKIFGSRSLDGWLDADDDETDVAAPPTAATNAPPPSAAPDAAAPGGPARRREERLAEVPAALTGANAALALAMEAAETAAAALAVADAACAADLKEEILADGFLESTEGDAEAAKRAVQAAESALSARRAALEEAASASEEVARLAEEARRSHEEKAREASEALEASAQIAVKVATLRMKATKRAGAAMAKAVAEEARNRDATPAAAAAAEEEPYVPE